MFFEQGIIYNSKGSRTVNSVKWILNFSSKIAGNPNILGVAPSY